MEVVLEKKDAGDWAYRGEGAANLVLAYTGSSPTFIGKVMRLQKARINGSRASNSPTALTPHELLLWKDMDDIVATSNKELASQLYVKHIMSPLLGSAYVDAGMRVPVSREFLESVEKNVISQRPASRVDATKVGTQSDTVLLMSDHSLFSRVTQEVEPSISVEIKPKCGFLPSSRFIDEGNSIKRSITRFRMHQALKFHDGEISEYSEYDPLDLFSGSKDRIHKAIKDLFSTPQNNFRVFLNGSLIFGGLGGGAHSTNLAIGGAFEDALKGVIQGGDGLRTKSFLQLIAETVHKSGVLDWLLEVQKLDNLDIDGAIHAYYDIISEPCMVCRELGKEEVSQKYLSLHSMSLDESLKIVKDFLIATSAKDCSLMISFRPRKDGNPGSPYNNLHLKSTNQSFDYKVNFIDLDLKHLGKMEEYYELDKKIVSCYNQMVETEERQKKTTSTVALKTAN
ncbi:inositol-pentakisphosphate 2-kinase-like [Malus sylvestris]|uniref:inositol-pentakisphosphate 2-kinase-like n=1 Tax=Malus sylvestris TaxID=3752 RepID=UPI0021ABA1E8|nr:inositol-pentakisphosphate 2-kinase-like [Malus sylvestris]